MNFYGRVERLLEFLNAAACLPRCTSHVTGSVYQCDCGRLLLLEAYSNLKR